MYCTKCGQQIEEASKFCTKCGAPAEIPEISQKSRSDSKLHLGVLKKNKKAAVIGAAFIILVVATALIGGKSVRRARGKDIYYAAMGKKEAKALLKSDKFREIENNIYGNEANDTIVVLDNSGEISEVQTYGEKYSFGGVRIGDVYTFTGVENAMEKEGFEFLQAGYNEFGEYCVKYSGKIDKENSGCVTFWLDMETENYIDSMYFERVTAQELQNLYRDSYQEDGSWDREGGMEGFYDWYFDSWDDAIYDYYGL